MNINLNEEDFRCLVSGGILTVHKINGPEIKIMLSDIGFHRMRKAIEDCYHGDLKAYSNLTKIISSY